MNKGIGGHHNPVAMKSEWLTPPEIIMALGQFDLDPCSPVDRPWDTALNHYMVWDDGLNCDWHGRVWCNPPYGKETGKWLARMAEHNNGIALTFARTETRMFFSEVWHKASALLFIEGRLHFHHVDGTRAKANAGGPSVLIAYGRSNALSLLSCTIRGKFIEL